MYVSLIPMDRESSIPTICGRMIIIGASVAQSSEQTPFTSEFLGSNPATDSCEKSQSTLCRKSWVFSGCSSFLPQEKLIGWVRINTVKKVISQWTIPQLSKILISTSLDKIPS